jgi:hypothetical protein
MDGRDRETSGGQQLSGDEPPPPRDTGTTWERVPHPSGDDTSHRSFGSDSKNDGGDDTSWTLKEHDEDRAGADEASAEDQGSPREAGSSGSHAHAPSEKESDQPTAGDVSVTNDEVEPGEDLAR